jgi:hypothetical protein
MRRWMILPAVMVLGVTGLGRAAAPGISPAVTAAIKGLSADDFAAREKAVADLQVALGQELRAMIPGDDPEAQARFTDLLSFEQGLCAWAKDVLKLPREKQKEALDFGLQPEVLPHAAHLYAAPTGVRVEAVKALGKIADPRAADLLAKALDDPEQAVYVAAMEAVYNRPPTPAVAEALWNRAVAAQFAASRGQQQAGPDRMTFLGNPIQVLTNGDNTLYQRTQDNALATDVLMHVHPPEIAARLKALLDEAEAVYNRKGPNGQENQDIWMYMPSQEAMKNATRLMAAYKSPEMVPGLYRIATGPALQRSQGQLNRQQMYFWSNRTWAIALVVQIAGQNPADWNLRTMAQLQGMWTMPSENDENAAIVKLRDWWKKEHDKYGAPEDTHPPTPPQDPLPPPDPQPRMRIMPLEY